MATISGRRNNEESNENMAAIRGENNKINQCIEEMKSYENKRRRLKIYPEMA